MATTKKITRKEIKQPDEFITFSARAIEFAQQHVREIAIGVASVLAVGLLIWAWSAYGQKREADAARLLAQAQALLQPAPTADEAGQPPSAETPSDPEREGRALVLLQDLVENYRRTKASRVARILLGQQYYEEGKYDAAIETYGVMLNQGGGKPELKAMAREGIAYAHEAKGEFSKALSHYEELSRSPLTLFQGWAYMGMARCYEMLGEDLKATEAYRSLLTDYPRHPKAAEAQASIARITQSLDAGEPATTDALEEPKQDPH
jgi:tetratricopeptide (TPR) repeat protein